MSARPKALRREDHPPSRRATPESCFSKVSAGTSAACVCIHTCNVPLIRLRGHARMSAESHLRTPAVTVMVVLGLHVRVSLDRYIHNDTHSDM